MRVLIFSSQYPPSIGGAEIQAERQARALANVGVTVHVLTPALYNNKTSPKEKDVTRFRLIDLSAILKIKGIGIINLPLLYLQAFLFTISSLRRYDLLHVHVPSHLAIGALAAAAVLRKPSAYKAAMAGNMSDMGELRGMGYSGRISALLLRWLTKNWIATTDDVITQLISAGIESRKVTKIPNGVPRNMTKITSAPKVRNFLCLGRLSTTISRDYWGVIEAFSKLNSENTDTFLAIVGDGDLRENLTKKAGMLPCSKNILFPGMQEPRKWLEWADCLVQPSRREGLSNAILEAMAAGLVIIAYDIPSNREILNSGRNGRLVPMNDRNQLYEAMKQVTEDEKNNVLYRLNSTQSVAESFDIDLVVAPQLIKFYENLTKTKCLTKKIV